MATNTDTEIEYGELPLQILSNDGIVVVYDANGAEVVPFTNHDWGPEGPCDEMVPRMVSALVDAYEDPASLLATNASWMQGQYEEREMWTDGANGPDWFTPEPLPEPPAGIDVDETPPLRVVLDDDASWPDDPEVAPDHEVCIFDEDDVVYQMHATEYREGPEQVSELIEAIRLAYEAPLELLRRQTSDA
ncbi:MULTISPECIES: hypothetical protein [unclassified Haloferax]|jgi:hypothetical protein|uniref:hypothetical protein n=1 Tax=unclassified Haloferax TaxID=2625095 RepID=UPI00287694B8|nr:MULTISPECIES: hypothetical protein [unclassified Haloferax]MDS0243069.1 hypothetical protein [Haloferax sp. S2CR25]MDS0446190.1 hypothetical protein [Haloferax sp. S2CR25-2]